MKAFKVKRNGRDYFRVDLPSELFNDGKRHSTMAATRREALDKAEKLTQQRKHGLDAQAAKTTLADFATRFLEFYKTEGGVSPRTWQDYRYHLDKNIVPYLGTISIGELKPLHVDQWSKSLRERDLGDRTLEYALAVLRRALQFAVEWEMIDRNPAGARFRAAKRKRTVRSGGKRLRFLDPEASRVFLKAIRGDRHEAMYALALTTGLRPEELYGLRHEDLDLINRRLTVNQVVARTRCREGEVGNRSEFGLPKTDKSRRTIDFPLFVVDLLRENEARSREDRQLAGERWRENDLVFPSQVGTPLEERNVLRRFQLICKENQLPKLRLYDLRHSHASLLIHEGVHPKKISERLGHSSIKLTMDTYGHLFEGCDRDSAEKMEKLFGSGSAAEKLHPALARKAS